MRRTFAALAIAVIVAASVLFTVERHWRGRGYTPIIVDAPDLWSLQRAKATSAPNAIVFLGASRTLYAIDRDTVRSRLPQYEPVMLAMDGRYPLATLRDLAADANFRGTVICDIDGAGFAAPSLDMQKPEVDFYRHEFSPSRAAHRLMLNHWQLDAVIARSDFSMLRSAVRWWSDEGAPFHPYQWLDRRRFGHIDFERGDKESQKRELARNLERFGGHLPRIPFAEWWPQVEAANGWVRTIQSRGGDVIFYASPTSGQRRWAEEDWFPRNEYWDRMVAATTAKTLFALDVPTLRDFPLPDDSHVDYRQKPAYTHALIDALIDRGLLQSDGGK
ncbi:MAG: hypothetical protein IPF83_13530 [Rhodanobacteraceae bacterium]|nr:hypothetical protein [Rhodanobacteraceae bacterium]MBP9155379.1 hypothetical protein [Xanthomonadales bacterium]HQW82178.1 hypothetical protein [Pseudomonadota bacterium]